MLKMKRHGAVPSAHRLCHIAQIVDMPMLPLRFPEMSRHPSTHPTRPKGTTDVEVIARQHVELVPTTDVDGNGGSATEKQRVGAGR